MYHYGPWALNPRPWNLEPWTPEPSDPAPALQIRFYEVDEAELDRMRAACLSGDNHFDITEEEFDMAAHNEYCASITEEVKAWTAQQDAASLKMQDVDAAILERCAPHSCEDVPGLSCLGCHGMD